MVTSILRIRFILDKCSTSDVRIHKRRWPKSFQLQYSPVFYNSNIDIVLSVPEGNTIGIVSRLSMPLVGSIQSPLMWRGKKIIVHAIIPCHFLLYFPTMQWMDLYLLLSEHSEHFFVPKPAEVINIIKHRSVFGLTRTVHRHVFPYFVRKGLLVVLFKLRVSCTNITGCSVIGYQVILKQCSQDACCSGVLSKPRSSSHGHQLVGLGW